MDLQADINWIKQELNKVTDPELINAFKSLLKYRSKKEQEDWWDTLDPEEKEDIEEGLKQADRGEFISHEEVMANPRKWD